MRRFGIATVWLSSLLLLGCPETGADEASDSVEESDADEKKKKKKKKGAEDEEKNEENDGSTAAAGGAKTPQLAFERLQKAVKDDDYKTVFVMLTKEQQNKMLTGMLIGSAITLAPMGTKPNPDKKKELDAILKKHGLEDTELGQKGNNPSELMTTMAKRLEEVKDRATLFDDLMRFLEKNSLRQRRFQLLSMEGLKVDGDTATATVVMKDEAGTQKRDGVELVKVDGRWYFRVLDWK